MNIFKELESDLGKIVSSSYPNEYNEPNIILQVPKDPLNGDIATNIAMILASKTKSNPREIALQLSEQFNSIPYIAHIEVAGPGFINFTIKAEKWHNSIKSILNEDIDFWEVNIGKGKKVNVEFVSANPTGPLHIGNARGAVYGDVLANILAKCGFNVTREYYINDAGSQIETLIDSTIIRYKEALSGKEADIPDGLYPGNYLKAVGQKLTNEYQNQLLNDRDPEIRKKIRKIAVQEMMKLIKLDLEKLGVHYDVFFSEKSLYVSGEIELAIKALEKKDLIYEGTLPPPKGKIDENWQPREQMLFKSSAYGDSQDRPVKKADDSWSYLAADFAYAKNKIDRGFEKLVYILGADHNGYIKRIEAVINALSDGKVESDIRTTQLVNFVKNDKILKMSKRQGQFMTVSQVVGDIGRDIIRFIMLTRSNDMILDFDFNKVVEQSKDNSVFYVQYAYVRANSIVNKAKAEVREAYDAFHAGDFDLSLLSSEEEIMLIKLLSSWPRILTLVVESCEPQKLVAYLIDIATKFHSIWNLGKLNNEYRFNIKENKDLTAARLAMVESLRKILAAGFNLRGVEPMESM